MRSKMRDSLALYLEVPGGAEVGFEFDAGAPVTGTVHPAANKALAVIATSVEVRIRFISRVQADRSSASRISLGSSVVRFAVKTRSQRALRYSSSESDGRLIVPIQPSPVSLSTFPLRRSTGMSSPSICVFTG